MGVESVSMMLLLRHLLETLPTWGVGMSTWSVRSTCMGWALGGQSSLVAGFDTLKAEWGVRDAGSGAELLYGTLGRVREIDGGGSAWCQVLRSLRGQRKGGIGRKCGLHRYRN